MSKKYMPGKHFLQLPGPSNVPDRILRAMNRKHTRSQYLDIICRVREKRPDIAISGDFIVVLIAQKSLCRIPKARQKREETKKEYSKFLYPLQ